MLILQKRPRITPWSSVISVPNGCTAPALALAFNTSQMLVRPSCVVPRQQKTMTFSEPYNLRSFYISSFIYRVVNVQKGNKKAVYTEIYGCVYALLSFRCHHKFLCQVCYVLWQYELAKYNIFRVMLPHQASDVVVSALGYTAINQTSTCDKRRAFTAANGKLDIEQPLLLFPCCIQ